MIKYGLQPNPVTPDPKDQSARVQANVTLWLSDIVRKALLRGSSLTETDLLGAATLLITVISDEVANGNNIVTPLVNIRPSIRGVFTSVSDSFDPSRHSKRASLSAGVLLTAKMRAARVEKVMTELPSPVPVEYSDANSGTNDTLLTPSGIGIITGEELKYDPENDAEGIFLISGDKTTRVAVVATRTEGKLVFNVPAGLAKGEYTLEVRKGYGNATNIRTGSLNDTLEVA